MALLSRYHVCQISNDADHSADWWCKEQGRYSDHGPFPTEAKANLFMQHRQEWDDGKRAVRPAVNHPDYQ